MRTYGALGRLDDARRVFKDMRAEGAWALGDTRGANVLLNALHSDVRLAFVRARQLLDEGLAPDTWTLNALLKGCMRARDARRADLACAWMDAAGVAPDETTFNTLVKVYSYAGDFEAALGVRERMAAAGLPPSPAVWGSLLVACGAAGQVETALMLWREMKAAAAAAGGRLSVDNYHAMMTACNSCYQVWRGRGGGWKAGLPSACTATLARSWHAASDPRPLSPNPARASARWGCLRSCAARGWRWTPSRST